MTASVFMFTNLSDGYGNLLHHYAAPALRREKGDNHVVRRRVDRHPVGLDAIANRARVVALYFQVRAAQIVACAADRNRCLRSKRRAKLRYARAIHHASARLRTREADRNIEWRRLTDRPRRWLNESIVRVQAGNNQILGPQSMRQAHCRDARETLRVVGCATA